MEPERNSKATLALSVIIPVFKEESTIGSIVEKVAGIPLVREIIVVDDGSSDHTMARVKELRHINIIRTLRHDLNLGKGAAIRDALKEVSGDLVIVQDADLEYDPSDYEALVQPFLDGSTCAVYGSRYLRCATAEWWHTLANRAMTFLSNLLNGTHLTDMETCYKVFWTRTITSLNLCCPRFGFEPEVTARLLQRGIRIREVPIKYHRRTYAEGKKIRLIDAVNTIIAILYTSFSR